jgi:Zn-dependent protease
MPSGGGNGLRFPLFGFPIRIHWTFLLIAVVIGGSGPDFSITRAAVWLIVVVVSVLVHELGHAFAARVVGAEPTIDLYALGGLTAFVPPRPLSRAQSVGISLAGPFAGFLLGITVLSAAAAFGADRHSPFVRADASVLEMVVGASIWVYLYWGAVNLLPILPLDGGTVVRSLLPGDDARRDRLATILSVAGAALLVVVLVRSDLEELIVLPLLLGALNVHALLTRGNGERSFETAEQLTDVLGRLDAGQPGALRRLAELSATLPEPLRDRAKVTAVEILARSGRVPEARQALQHLPGTAHPALYALVDVASGDRHGIAMLDEMVLAQPAPSVARYALLARVLAGDAAAVPAAFGALPLTARAPESLREAQYFAHLRKEYVAAARIGELQLQLGGPVDPWVLYNTACSWSQAGEQEHALLRLAQAVDAGWSDGAQLDADQDLAPLWVSDRFREIRRRVVAPSGTAPA